MQPGLWKAKIKGQMPNKYQNFALNWHFWPSWDMFAEFYNRLCQDVTGKIYFAVSQTLWNWDKLFGISLLLPFPRDIIA